MLRKRKFDYYFLVRGEIDKITHYEAIKNTKHDGIYFFILILAEKREKRNELKQYLTEQFNYNLNEKIGRHFFH